jgi:hypothetical protein
MVQLVVKRVGRGLYPADGLAETEVYTLPANIDLRAEVANPRRSVPQLRLYWAILQLVAENMDKPTNRNILHQWVKLRCGVVDDLVLRSGEIIELPGSIAIDQMDETAFNSFFDQALTHITAGLTNLAREDLIAEAERMLDRARTP